MEATKEGEDLLDAIRPPRLEDAGLEDCALPPESIQEAFLKAAAALGSRSPSIFATPDDESDDCLAGVGEAVECSPPPGSCAAEKSGGLPGNGVTDAEETVEGCADGLQGLKIAEEGKKPKNEEAEREECHYN
ncbi:uncharacterized protein LOC127793755 [Diospyros lotus]|uniref:uncharacterized protein LOC127793755 n=1 Tax=Diospyros lotus TaxID=55363 RepID=UPI002258EDB7|nr:uncharacterized protein LOC127793755 [Diospyros lotus]